MQKLHRLVDFWILFAYGADTGTMTKCVVPATE